MAKITIPIYVVDTAEQEKYSDLNIKVDPIKYRIIVDFTFNPSLLTMFWADAEITDRIITFYVDGFSFTTPYSYEIIAILNNILTENCRVNERAKAN